MSSLCLLEKQWIPIHFFKTVSFTNLERLGYYKIIFKQRNKLLSLTPHLSVLCSESKWVKLKLLYTRSLITIPPPILTVDQQRFRVIQILFDIVGKIDPHCQIGVVVEGIKNETSFWRSLKDKTNWMFK